MIKFTAFWIVGAKANALAPLRLRVRWNNGKFMTSFTLGTKIDPTKWIKGACRVKANTLHGKFHLTPAAEVNKLLELYETTAHNIMSSLDEIPSIDEFVKEFDRRTQRVQEVNYSDLFEMFDLFIKTESKNKSWELSTLKRWTTVRSHLVDVGGFRFVEDITKENLQRLLDMYISRGYKNSYIEKCFKLLKWFVVWMKNNDIYKGDAMDKFDMKMKKVEGVAKSIIYLTWDELMTLYDAPLADGAEKRARDVFCFCCFTGLRYSDVYALKRCDLHDTEIHVTTQKTSDSLIIELNDFSKEILDRYADYTFRGDKALPVVSNQKMNDYIKAATKKAGIESTVHLVYYRAGRRVDEIKKKYEVISTHCGRRTFVVNALYLGIPAEVIMKWTGHSNFEAMKPYMDIVDDLKRTEMQKFNRVRR